MMYQMYQMMQGLGYGMGSLGLIFWINTLLVWTILVLVIVALVRWLNKK